MRRLSRIVSSYLVGFSLVGLFSWNCATAQEVPPAVPAAPATPDATAAPATPAAPDVTAAPASQPSEVEAAPQPTLPDLVDTFWHYGKIARYDLAADAGNAIAAMSPDGLDVLQAFETVAAAKGDNIDYWMLRWESLPLLSDEQVGQDSDARAARESVRKMRQATLKLVDLINQGYEARRSNPTFIRGTIIEMAKGARAYDNNLPRVAKSGELAVKVLVDILRTPDDRRYHTVARRILRDLGRSALSPLLAATEMKDSDTLVDIIAAIGDIGYDAAVPYLDRLAVGPGYPETVHTAARNALTHMGAADPSTVNPADQFYQLGEKLYYNKADIGPSGDKIAYIWFWREDRGLTKLDVPTSIFGDVMAMRECEYALKLDPTKANAMGLWLAANSKREADLPAGAGDPTHRNVPDAHYYNVSAGVQYLNSALARAIHDRNAAVALKLTQALKDIIGQSNMSLDQNSPITQALFFPNRQVRYEAAFALAASLPSRAFSGSDRVVPLLVEAISQASKPNVLVVAPDQNDQMATLRGAIQSLGYPVVSSNDPTAAANAAMVLPAVDIIIISDQSDVRRMIELEQSTGRLQGASMIVLTQTSDNPYVSQSAVDPLLNTAVMPAKSVLADSLKYQIEKARQHAGAIVVTEDTAASYALRAAQLLAQLALSRDQVLNISQSEGGVLAALSDTRPEIAQAAGRVLAMLNSQAAQNGLAARAIDATVPATVRVSFLKNLTSSAKFFGNRLGSDKIQAIEAIVATEKDPAIREAAAEARGALNLPADQARTLILKQSRV